MRYTVDEDRMKSVPGGPSPVASLDPAKPPVKELPMLEFPRVVYKHPKEPFRRIEHRNTQHEVVDVETVPTEHLTKVVANAEELAKALKQGWLREPYIPQAPPDPDASLYESELAAHK